VNVGAFLANSAAKYPERTAIIDGGARRSFRELDDRCGRLAGSLMASGLQKGDRVAALFYNGVHFVEVYFAAVKAGLIPTPINFRLTAREILYLLRDSRAKALFYDPAFEGAVQEILDRLEFVRLFVSPGAGGSSPARDYEQFLSDSGRVFNDEALREDDLCQLMYTSGTTGRPKGALISHGNVIWNLFNTMYGREDREGQVSIIVGPLYHTAALNNHLTIQIALGGTSVLIRKFEPESLLRTIQERKATVVSGSPAMYNLLLQSPEAGRYDVGSVTKLTAGADKLSAHTKQRLMEFFPNIRGVYDVYGCTEASPCVTILNARDSLRKDYSVGRALPFLQAGVVNDAGESLPAGEVGELVCKGPNVMQGYFNDPDATRLAIRDGWLHTGDLARIDEEGFFYIVDRMKDMIVSGGENIYPRELEEVLITHPRVRDVAVVGVPDPTWGERVKAFIVPMAGAALSESEIIQFCKERLAGYKKPKEVSFLDEIPRNPSGKALKKLLRELEAPHAGHGRTCKSGGA